MTKEEWLAQREKRLQQERAEEEAANAQAAQPPPPPQPATRPRRLGRESDEEDTPPEPNKSKTLTRPKNLNEWKPEDFLGAQRDGDPRLTDAIRHLAKHSVGDQDAAKLLTELLEASGTDAAGREEEENPKFVEAAIAALAVNGTPAARRTLERLVAGTLPVANPQSAATAALKALLARNCPENEDLLLRVITAPERPTKGEGTEIDPQKLRHLAIALLETTASEALRVRLAKAMIAPETSAALYEQLWACLREARPENLAAQAVLYQSGRLDPKTQDFLEQRFAEHSGEVLRILLGFPLSRQRDAANAASGARMNPYRSAEIIWSSEFAGAVERRLRLVDSLSGRTRLISLAAAIPSPALRSALLRDLQRHWDEGPKSLEPLLKSENTAVEPGFIVLTKMLLRKDDGGSRAENDVRGGAAKAEEIRRIKQLQEETAQRWADFSRSLVCAACRQLRLAAQTGETASPKEPSTDNAQFPVKLYPNADVVAVYRLEWPADLNGMVAAAPSLGVLYMRLEVKAKPTRLLAFYRRQLPDFVERDISGGRWLDSLIAKKDQTGVRAIDVVLAKANPHALGLPDQEQDLTVDILVIDCEIVARRNFASAGR